MTSLSRFPLGNIGRGKSKKRMIWIVKILAGFLLKSFSSNQRRLESRTEHLTLQD
jgi:hypothetical protein